MRCGVHVLATAMASTIARSVCGGGQLAQKVGSGRGDGQVRWPSETAWQRLASGRSKSAGAIGAQENQGAGAGMAPWLRSARCGGELMCKDNGRAVSLFLAPANLYRPANNSPGLAARRFSTTRERPKH